MHETVEPTIATLAAPTFNVFILVAVLGYVLRKPLADFVKNRHHQIRGDLEGAGTLLRNSKAKFEEFSSKLKAIDVEISSLRDQARQSAAATQLRVVTDAKKLAGVIVTDATQSAQILFSDLRQQLVADFAKRVLDRAETGLRARLTGDDRTRIRKEFSQKVETLQ